MPYRRRGHTERRRALLIGLAFAGMLAVLGGGLAWMALHDRPELAARPEPHPYSGNSAATPDRSDDRRGRP